MVSYGNKYPRHNARPDVVEQSGQCARAHIIAVLPETQLLTPRSMLTFKKNTALVLMFIDGWVNKTRFGRII